MSPPNAQSAYNQGSDPSTGGSGSVSSNGFPYFFRYVACSMCGRDLLEGEPLAIHCKFWFSSCGHFLCDSPKHDHKQGVCTFCTKQGVRMYALKANLNPEIEPYFKASVRTMDNALRTVKFQHEAMASHIDQLRGQVTKLNKAMGAAKNQSIQLTQTQQQLSQAQAEIESLKTRLNNPSLPTTSSNLRNSLTANPNPNSAAPFQPLRPQAQTPANFTTAANYQVEEDESEGFGRPQSGMGGGGGAGRRIGTVLDGPVDGFGNRNEMMVPRKRGFEETMGGPQSDGTIHPGQQTYTPRPNKIPLNRNGMQNMRIGGAMSGEGMGGASRPASRANLQQYAYNANGQMANNATGSGPSTLHRQAQKQMNDARMMPPPAMIPNRMQNQGMQQQNFGRPASAMQMGSDPIQQDDRISRTPMPTRNTLLQNANPTPSWTGRSLQPQTPGVSQYRRTWQGGHG